MSTATATCPDAARLTLGETARRQPRDGRRQLRKVLRRPTYIVYLFVQPVILVLLFRYVFGGAIDTGSVELRRLPDARDHRHDRDLRRADHRPRPHRGHQGGRRRPLPLAADRPLGCAGRPHRRRPGDQRADARP